MQPIPVIRNSASPPPSAASSRQTGSTDFADLFNQQLAGTPSSSSSGTVRASGSPAGQQATPDAGKMGAQPAGAQSADASTPAKTSGVETSSPSPVAAPVPLRTLSALTQTQVSTPSTQTSAEMAAGMLASETASQNSSAQIPGGENQNPAADWSGNASWAALLTKGTNTTDSSGNPGAITTQPGETKKSLDGMANPVPGNIYAGLLAINPMGNGQGASPPSNIAGASEQSKTAGVTAAMSNSGLAPMAVDMTTVAGNLSASNGVGASEEPGVTARPSHAPVLDGTNPLLSSALMPSPVNAMPLTVATPVGQTAAWGQDVAQSVTWMVGQHLSAAELQLNPPNLGPLTVVVQMAGNQANAFFSSPHAAVRDALQQALPHLGELLASSGLTLGQATVGDQRSGSGQHGQSFSRSGHYLSSRNALSEVSSGLSAVQPLVTTTTVGLIDTFA